MITKFLVSAGRKGVSGQGLDIWDGLSREDCSGSATRSRFGILSTLSPK